MQGIFPNPKNKPGTATDAWSIMGIFPNPKNKPGRLKMPGASGANVPGKRCLAQVRLTLKLSLFNVPGKRCLAQVGLILKIRRAEHLRNPANSRKYALAMGTIKCQVRRSASHPSVGTITNLNHDIEDSLDHTSSTQPRWAKKCRDRAPKSLFNSSDCILKEVISNFLFYIIFSSDLYYLIA